MTYVAATATAVAELVRIIQSLEQVIINEVRFIGIKINALKLL